MNLEICIPKEPDLEDIFRLEAAVFSTEGTQDSPETVRLRWLTFPDGFIVGKVDGKIITYASSEKWAEIGRPKLFQDPRNLHRSDGRVLCITSLAVDESMRGKGVGSKVLAHLIQVAVAQQCSYVILETVNARKFYEQYGFRVSESGIDSGHSVEILVREIDATSI